MSYAHRYRIGANYSALPANKPKCPVHHYHRDGNFGGAVNYEPNSFGGPKEDPRYLEPPLKISGDADRYNHREGNDDYTQPGNLFRLMNDSQKQQLFSNMAEAMQGVPERIKVRQAAHCYKADPAYGNGIAKALGIDQNHVIT
jgi:catalase